MGCWPCLPQYLLLPGHLLPKVAVLPSAGVGGVGGRGTQTTQPLLECHPSPLCMYVFFSKYSSFLPSLNGSDHP